ncbi:MAG TPA: TolC family protein [Allosphingosinicella sp.]|jgi:NodT family efflux transporter outer membrane factor (OMF) lipoprotein
MRPRLPLASFASSLALAACAPTAHVAAPPPLQSTGWSSESPAGGDSAFDLSFGSGELERLLAAARSRNTDIAVAAARIIQARGELGEARIAPVLALGAAGGSDLFRESRSLGLDISWELDLFGRVDAAKRAARARFAAAYFDRDAVALAAQAETARAYVLYAALGDRLDILDRSLAAAREVERIIAVRIREGAASRIEAGRQGVEVRRLEAQRVQLAEARGHARNALAVLVGEEAPLFTLADTRLAGMVTPPPRPSTPAALLDRRPDLLSAEARIRAAKGDVDAARAAFLPSLTVSAGSLLGGAARGGPLQLAVSAGSSLLAPIFDRGRLKGRLTTAGGAQIESVELYRHALLVALQESEDALAAAVAARQRHGLLVATAEEARRTAALVRRQYVEGGAGLQDVLDAERALLAVEDERALARRDELDAAIDLWKAMGG